MTEPKNEQLRALGANVPTSYMAEVLGLAASHVSQLFSKRVIVQNGKRGRYDLTDAVPKYIQSIRTSGTAEAGERLKIQQERKLRLLNDATAGDLVKVSDAAEVFRAASMLWKSIADGLPKRIASRLARIENPDEIRMIVRDALDGMYYEFEKGLDLP